MDVKPNYYSNPAFCQQSEYYHQKRALSPQGSVRQSPVGAQTSHVVFDNSLSEIHDNPEELVDNIEEQEFYEEVIVDNNGFIKGKKFVVVAQNNEGQKYIQLPQEERKGSRYGSTQQIHYNSPKNPPLQNQNSRYEYIPLQEQDPRCMPDALARSTPKKSQMLEEHVEIVPGIVHRYAVIEAEEETALTSKNEKYALVPVNQLNTVITSQNQNRYEYIKESPAPPKVHQVPQQQPNRYEYIQNTPPKNNSRYEYIQQSPPKAVGGRYDYPPAQRNPPRPGTNPIATQKLHELLSTPKKTKRQTPQRMMVSPHTSRRTTVNSPPLSPITKDPFQTPRNSPQRTIRPSLNSKVQQKLNYAIGSKQFNNNQEKRQPNTAIVPPMCSSPVQSIYGETTYSQKSESWMNLSVKGNTASGQALAIAAFIMFMCGVATTGLCFYMLSFMGRPYYLDFGTVAGFTCAIMGILGFRSRNVYWLPNRNYLSGYLILSLFSILTCTGLILLLVYDPDPGTPLADMTSAAVCGFSVLTLILALTGVVSSYCCKYPPPDNRVQHCSPGLTV
ncbi:unnamed protein product [Ceutorhynchus assimilis]|uniref:Sanpodo n=1 Tax=Ceutorhynchus assimilis TaxID=467358 RepID=A0A9N9QH90_9CUCU|nr:unnamed protein product [Ceutorhynchus assimilis]